MCADCGPTSECGAITDSGVTISGTLTISDAEAASLVIAVCMDSSCSESSSTPAPTASAIDGGRIALEYVYASVTSDGGGAIILTQTVPNTYDVEGRAYFDLAPSGTATSGTVTIRITSGSTDIYSQSFPVQYQTGTTCGSPYELCSVTL
jgi:hypothetical protein